MREWLSVLFSGALWGGGMAWMNASRNPPLNTRKGRILFVLEFIFAGLLFGVLVTFHWHQVVHPPLVFITMVAFAGMFISALFTREQKPGHTKPEEQNPLSIPPHLR